MGSMMPAEKARKCITVLTAVVKCNDAPVESAKFDVITELIKSLGQGLLNSDLEWADDLFTRVATDCWPTTSSSPQGTIVDDPRVRLGYLLAEIYYHLAEYLTSCRDENLDEYTVLSIQEQNVVTASVQFFVLAQLLPYLETGIGVPANRRSSFVKSWKRIGEGNTPLKQAQIARFLSTMQGLTCSSKSIKEKLLTAFLGDIICAGEQLNHLSNEKNSWVEEIVKECDEVTLVTVLMTLTKTYDTQKGNAPWYINSIGSRLSLILRSKGGLVRTLKAYIVMLGDEEFWNNASLLHHIGCQLALVPSGVTKMAYYENMHGQFMDLLKREDFSHEGVYQLYTSFVDRIATISKLAGDVFVLDRIFKPFERLVQIPDNLTFTSKMFASLDLLSILLSEKRCPRLIGNSVRLRSLCPIILGFYSSPCFSRENTPGHIKQLQKTIFTILKFTTENMQLLGSYFLTYITSTEDAYYQIEYKPKLVAEIDDETIPVVEIMSLPKADKEDLIMAKMNAVALDKSTSSWVLISILCDSASLWSNSVESGNALRFTAVNDEGNEWTRMATHLVTLYCFEQLAEWDLVMTHHHIVEAMSKLIITILERATEWLQDQKDSSSFFDISIKPTEEEKRFLEVRRTSVKMAVGLIAGVVAAGTVESMTQLPLIAVPLAKFITQIRSISKSEELMSIANDATEVLELLKTLGVKTNVPNKTTVKASGNSRPTLNYMEQLKKDLDDEMIPVRGNALIRVSRAVQRKDTKVVEALEPWLYAKVKELVKDEDSYVYLSAINALAEIACYDTNKYLEKLLALFQELGTEQLEDPDKADKFVQLRGKFAEAIGKVFLVLGDVSPAWIDRSANVFLACLKDKHDIIRASSLSTFSNLILSCRGQGFEKILTELLYAVNCLVETDPSDLVRRSAVMLVRHCLRSCDKHLLRVAGDHLKIIRRNLARLYKWDSDYVVRLHAELCLEEIKYCLQSSLDSEVNDHLRVIKIK